MNIAITVFSAGMASTAAFTALAADTASEAKALPEVILLGDSIRMSYQAGVRKRLESIARVWAPKDNCSDTVHTLKNLDRWLEGRNPAVIHINCGLHDMWLFDAEKRRHTVEVYAANLRKILGRLREKTDATIIFALTTPVNENYQASSGYGRVVRYEKDIPRYNMAAKAVAAEMNIPVDDLYTPLFREGIDSILGKDGVHLSAKGVEIAADTVANCIREHLGGE
ncbi:MAG: hypothetical protein GXP31_00650 [Kiritimatiellaeota bacterium]|nr:hypothetical protein [Kiritimatiellota bacterium]